MVASLAFTVADARSAVPQAMAKAPSSPANKTRTSLHQEIDFKAAPHRIYQALLDSKQFTAFSGVPADITPEPGGAFKMFDGAIVGRNIELVSDQRIVQAWRPDDWPAGIYSVVRFELKSVGPGTRVILDHTGFPEGGYEHLSIGWKEHYWAPLTKFLA